MVTLSYSRPLEACYSGVGLGLITSKIGMDLALLGKPGEDIKPSELVKNIIYLQEEYFPNGTSTPEDDLTDASLGNDYAINQIGVEIWRKNPELLTAKLNKIRKILETGINDVEQGRYGDDNLRGLKDLVFDMSQFGLEVVGRYKQGAI